MHRSRKPVRKCNGCGLNFRDVCGVYDNPRGQWSGHNRCPGFKNQELLAEYKARMAKAQENEQRKKRVEAAKQRHTEPHRDGDRHVLMSARQ